jgi:hypothetical protein
VLPLVGALVLATGVGGLAFYHWRSRRSAL